MCADVILLTDFRHYTPGQRVTLALNTAIEMVEAGRARWPSY